MGQRDTGTAVEAGASLDALALVVGGLAGEFRLEPLLELVLRSSVGLLGCRSGSLSLIDAHTRTYRKHIDMEAGCQAGNVFPLTEGVTGAVARTGRAVIHRRYCDVPGGHISPASELYRRAVLGVPIRYRADVIGSLIVFAADDDRSFTDADAELLQRFADHAAVAMANSRLHTQASERDLTAAVRAERERAMLDMHDALGRGLATVLLQLQRAEDLARAGGLPLGPLRDARETAESLLHEGRRAAWGWKDVSDALPLEEAIRLELEWTQAVAGVKATLRTFGDRQPVHPGVATQLIRIVKECLTNVAQHADATSVRVGLVYLADGLAAVVEDDGRGFDLADHASAGMGLSGLVARATLVGGRVQLESTPGWGTRIRADLPYRPAPDDVAPGQRLRVVVVHDQPAMRAGIVHLLGRSEPGVQVVAESDDVPAAVEAVRLLRPRLVLLGSRIAATEGTGVVARLHETDPELPILLLLDGPDAAMREWASAGVRGFVPSDADAVALGRAVVAAAQGDVLVFSGILQRLGGLRFSDGSGNLTGRELQVLDLLRLGLADKQIAARLHISVKTVEKHVGAVLRKHGVRSRTELIAQG